MMSKRLDSEDFQTVIPQSMCREVFSYPVISYDHVIYIGPLDSVENELSKIQIIRTAAPGDTIRLVINSPGGYVSLAMSYISAINESAARIVTHAEGTVASAGTLLWLAGEEKTVSPMTQFMFHNYQSYAEGDGANMFAQVTFSKAYFDRVFRKFYSSVLTEDEMRRIIGGGQVWLDEEEILTRTKAVLLTKEYLRQVREGKIAEYGDEEVVPEGPPALKVSKCDGSEVYLELDSLTADKLSCLNAKELYAVILEVASFAGMTVKDLSVTRKTPRSVLEKVLMQLVPLILSEGEEGQ